MQERGKKRIYLYYLNRMYISKCINKQIFSQVIFWQTSHHTHVHFSHIECLNGEKKKNKTDYNFLHVSVPKQIHSSKKIIFPFSSKVQFVYDSNRNLRKPNMCQMVGGETWATRTVDRVGGGWTLAELHLRWEFYTEILDDYYSKMVLFHWWHVPLFSVPLAVVN